MSNHEKQGQFCWNELMTNDTNACKKFYGELFGWQTEDHDMGQGCTYTLLKQDGKDVGGMMKIPADHSQIPPHWMSYVYVNDVDAVAQKAKQLGATIKQEPTNVADFGKFSIIQDPSGAHIALWQSLKSSC
jgi:predicted enzyme related to lactoylglutathione lyase